MTGFSIDWLDRREAADIAARDPALLDRVAELLSGADEPLVVDLACGTGATLRALAPKLKKPAAWRLVDADPALLAEAERRAKADGVAEVDIIRLDLSGNVLFPFQDAALATASALFDLVSEAFVARLVATLASRRGALYAALSYDGTMAWTPEHSLDQPVLDAFNRHQRRDKGFGPALGPKGVELLITTLDRAGYRVTTAPSPWRLGPDDADLLADTVRIVAGAVVEEGSLGRDSLDDWLAFRLDHVADGTLVLGHLDLLAEPG